MKEQDAGSVRERRFPARRAVVVMEKYFAGNVSAADCEDAGGVLPFLKHLEIPLMIRVLKERASGERPMSARKISDELSAITGLDHSEKTVLRKLQKLTALQDSVRDTELGKILYLSLGGRVAEVSGKTGDHPRAQSRYYFEPFLDQSDVDMICGTITSNRYLTQKEKDYLISRQQALASGKRPAAEERPLPEKPAGKKDGGSARVLSIVNRLHEAITKQIQVKIIYGAYGISEKKPGTVELKPKNRKKPYVLNPYALLWNDGEYYLLATHRGHTNPSHFRVDRILAVEKVCRPEDATQPAAREKLPDSLKPFFRRTGGVYEFLDEKYTTTYPMMAIYGEKDLCSGIIECRSNAIGVVVDYFGTGIRLLPPRLDHDPQETDLNGNPITYVAIKLPYAQYDNVKAFCLLQQGLVRAVAPDRLVQDVGEKLKEDMRRYQAESAKK